MRQRKKEEKFSVSFFLKVKIRYLLAVERDFIEAFSFIVLHPLILVLKVRSIFGEALSELYLSMK